ncbi:hypothetical protein [Paraburkholderia megapolitana]|uniref:Uncharacterized protein n=1 Tax=Paraburkholderia megapolitana TaxID=420953 RepID=A0A1I3SNM8_9BURK|nr:hypothetical protein [Paraburkholderia megapolitana]QDQ85659.1 hypothetical protein FNZ07_32240 [Paraburkholderia megapolitana]SFJ59201.1 hypothetical protein SAMN05192543_108262 [Paraburkholderia megapolitana]
MYWFTRQILALVKAREDDRLAMSPLRLMPIAPLNCAIMRSPSAATPLSLKRSKLQLVSAASPPSAVSSVAADGQYESMGQGISICISRVGANTYTWSFRNDSFVTVTTLRFRSTYIDLKTGRKTSDENAVPVHLAPGRSIGGWSAWVAYSPTPPIVKILEIERITQQLHKRCKRF